MHLGAHIGCRLAQCGVCGRRLALYGLSLPTHAGWVLTMVLVCFWCCC
jgi:hypothetical protein